MKIYVDADACPGPVKEIVLRAATRLALPLVLVANQPLKRPPGRGVRVVTVSAGFDAADDWIVAAAEAGDVVISADIPLAAKLVANGVAVINPRGALYTPDNIGEVLSLRNAMDELRSAGLAQTRTAPFGERDRQAFAATLDRLLARRPRGG